MRVGVAGWAAWAPGLETRASWRDWARAPQPLAREGQPDARFLPAMLRRRCTPLSRILLWAAMEACPQERRAEVRTVFSSRHGSINESVALLENVARGEKLSPARFSHTVHNAQAGLFSIATGNRCASSSLAAREDSFGCGLLEALGHLEREPQRPVLFVTGDVPLDPVFASLVDEPTCAYGVGLLLCRDADQPGFRVSVRPAQRAGRSPWPPAAAFLGGWLREESRFGLETARHAWSFLRSGPDEERETRPGRRLASAGAPGSAVDASEHQ